MSDPLRIHLDLPAIRLSALDYGAPFATAPTMVMLHGMADLAWSMDPVARGLADRCHVISLDLRGHGDSDQPGAYSILHYASDLRGVISLLGLDRPVVVGHSLGGQVTAQFAGLFPELVRGIVIAEGIGPPVRFKEDLPSQRLETWRGRVEMLGMAAHSRPLPDVAAAAARLAKTHVGLGPERALFLASVGTKPGPDGGVVWKFDPRTRDWLASFDRPATEERWQAVQCPVLAVTGALAWERWWKEQSRSAATEGWTDQDPTEIARRVALFADAEYVNLPDAGHMLPFDAPDELVRVTRDFLARRLGI